MMKGLENVTDKEKLERNGFVQFPETKAMGR